MIKRRPTAAKMCATHAAIFEVARAIVEPAGFSIEYSNGHKHAFLVIRRANTFRKITISHGTKNLKHQKDWARQNTQRALREMTAITAGARRGET